MGWGVIILLLLAMAACAAMALSPASRGRWQSSLGSVAESPRIAMPAHVSPATATSGRPRSHPSAIATVPRTITRGQGNVIGGLLLMQLILALSLATRSFDGNFDVPKWEYMIVAPSDTSFESDMRLWGTLGWEVVSARRATSSSVGDPMYELILKRPKR